jgi:2-dehydro-3-deoxy-D-arabinonate dehydratase
VILYSTANGFVLEHNGGCYSLAARDMEEIVCRPDLDDYLDSVTAGGKLAEPPSKHDLLAPIGRQEVWAAGVTYFRSRTARMQESEEAGGSRFYDRVYSAERPELFFKALPHKVVGPGGKVAIRSDARWSVPEPELALLINPWGRIVGYTIGNDMSSRDIEGENLLFLPQAKIYDRSCALGPGILIHRNPLPPTTAIELEVKRQDGIVFSGRTTLTEMKRRPEELVEYLFRDQTFSWGCFLLTGTGIVPQDSFTLAPGDTVRIMIGGIGVLENQVAVPA